MKKPSKLTPEGRDWADDAGITFELLRDYSKAEEYYNMSIMLHPDWDYPYS